jgi:hypothetical protein
MKAIRRLLAWLWRPRAPHPLVDPSIEIVDDDAEVMVKQPLEPPWLARELPPELPYRRDVRRIGHSDRWGTLSWTPWD